MRIGWIVPVVAVVVAAGCSSGAEIDGRAKVEGSQADPPSLTDLLPDRSDFEAGVTIETTTPDVLFADAPPSLSPADCGDLWDESNDVLKQFWSSTSDAVSEVATTRDSGLITLVTLVNAPYDFAGQRDFVQQCPDTDTSYGANGSEGTGTQKVELEDVPASLSGGPGVSDTHFAKFDQTIVDAGTTTASTAFNAWAVVDGVSVFVNSIYGTGISEDGTFTPLRDADRRQPLDLLIKLVDSISATS